MLKTDTLLSGPSLPASILEFWKKHRYVHLKDVMSPTATDDLRSWTDDLGARPETAGKWMKYFEGEARQLCRVENFTPYHDGFRDLLSHPALIEILSQLMDDPAVLFKEKINFKLPQGQGFAPHQDAPAFTTFDQKFHVTVMIAVDPSTIENGCLEVVEGFEKEELLPQSEDGTIRADIAESLQWKPVEMKPGEILIFDSYIPHRSAPNRSTSPRRALYVTYNRSSEGSVRDAYFEHKRRSFPPEIERVAGAPLPESAKRYNLGNPIR